MPSSVQMPATASELDATGVAGGEGSPAQTCALPLTQAPGVGIDEGAQFGRRVGGDPARAGVLAALEPDVGVVFGLQAVLDHFELQLADRAQQHRPADLRAEHLDRAFLAELREALLQLL